MAGDSSQLGLDVGVEATRGWKEVKQEHSVEAMGATPSSRCTCRTTLWFKSICSCNADYKSLGYCLMRAAINDS